MRTGLRRVRSGWSQSLRFLSCAVLLCLCIWVYYAWRLSLPPAHPPSTPHASLHAPLPRARPTRAGLLPAGAGTAAPPPQPRKQVLALYRPQFGEGAGGAFAALRSVRVAETHWDYPVVRPFEGFYDVSAYQVRQRQGRLAQAYGVDGFVYHHYWQGGAAQQSAGLEAMLVDGEPNLPFALAWDNGGSGAQSPQEEWRAHFDWLLPFFRHGNHLTRGAGRPLLFLAVCQGAAVEAMLRAWRDWALAAGLPGLYVVQMNGEEWAPGALQQCAAADGVVEVQPTLERGSSGGSEAPSLRTLQGRDPATYGATLDSYFRGVHAGYNDRPRGGAAGTVLVYHPTNLKAALRAQLALTPPGSFVLLNAWNDWATGSAVEPSVEQGFSWLEAVQEATRSAAPVGGDFLPRLAPAGVESSEQGGRGQSAQRVCILVRTYIKHDDATEALFNLGRMLRTLVALEHTAWEAHVVDTGEHVFSGMRGIAEGVGDARIHVFDTPAHLRQPYLARTSSYDLTDYALQHACSNGRPHPLPQWFVVTNGDNFYAPDAFNYLPAQADMVLMNFYSRYSLANALTFTNAGLEGCCSRITHYRCTPASAQIAFVDVGAMVVRVESWNAAALTFARFHGACGAASCHDGALAQYVLDTLHWRLAYHPATACAMHHNPNPVSCTLVGGLYLDAPDWAQAQCFEPADFADVPISKNDVNWQKFMAGEGCVCKEL